LNPIHRTIWFKNSFRLDQLGNLSEKLKSIKKIWQDWLQEYDKRQQFENLSYERQTDKRRRQTLILKEQIQARTVNAMSARLFRDWTSTEMIDQYDKYTVEPVIKSLETFSSLSWWQDPVRRERWPKLSEFAIMIFSFPPMSDKAERIFSGARRTIS
jgi:hypothetical protein